jgi:thiol-disulfide isomerase/thioredoxin
MSVGAFVLLAALAVASGLGLLWRRSTGQFRGAASTEDYGRPTAGTDHADPDPALAPIDIPGSRGERGTLLQFSTAFCAPCRATRRTLAEVAAMMPGVNHVEVDAEAHLALVRELGVMRTPTTFVLDADGAVVSRASGAPRKADVIAALGRAIQ